MFSLAQWRFAYCGIRYITRVNGLTEFVDMTDGIGYHIPSQLIVKPFIYARMIL